MKIAYAFRRSTYYPFEAGAAWSLPDERALPDYLGKVRDIGFDGVELGLESFGGLDATENEAKELQKRLTDAGTPCVSIRAGGALCYPQTAKLNRQRLEKAVEIASWIGASVVNTALSGPPQNRMLDTGPSGAAESHGSSQMASQEDFIRTAKALREVGAMAGDNGIDITIEVHQHSIADNSWSTLHLLELADSPFVARQPGLGQCTVELCRAGRDDGTVYIRACGALQVLALQEPQPRACAGARPLLLHPRAAAQTATSTTDSPYPRWSRRATTAISPSKARTPATSCTKTGAVSIMCGAFWRNWRRD